VVQSQVLGSSVYTSAPVCLLARDTGNTSQGPSNCRWNPLWLCQLGLTPRGSAFARLAKGLTLTNRPGLECSTVEPPPPGGKGM
jgi:hypothetical protein